MIALLLTAWLVAAGFRDTVTCTVQGYLYVMPDEAPAFTRADNCPGVKWRIEANALVLYSPHMIVTVVLPARTQGQAHFWYRWGADRAHLEADDWPIAYGPIVPS